MCLTIVVEDLRNNPRHTRKPQHGWKVFKRDEDGNLVGPYYRHIELSPTSGRYVDSCSANTNETASDYSNYEPGFHIFTNRSGARKYKKDHCADRASLVAKVLYNDVVATGWQNNDMVVVARRMKLAK